jgi:hypothetical protein
MKLTISVSGAQGNSKTTSRRSRQGEKPKARGATTQGRKGVVQLSFDLPARNQPRASEGSFRSLH